MGKKKNRRYTSEFKQQAVSLANRIGASKAARQLGVPMGSLYGWQSESKRKGSKAAKPEVDLEGENRRLQKENDELRKVNQILKKAAAFFSQDHLK